MSMLQQATFGSSLSLRAAMRMGSMCSACAHIFVGQNTSVLDFVELGDFERGDQRIKN